MFQITINEKGGQAKSLDFDKAEITIGRVQGNDIVLPKGNISKRHSRIVLKDGKFIIIDMQSTNGTYVNGKKITSPQVVKGTDKIYIGDFTLQLSGANGAEAAKGRAAAAEPEPDLADAGGDELDSGPRGAAGPGLIDDNFDQEFEGTSEPPPEPARPARAQPAAPSRAKPAPVREPEPEPELDLDLDGGGADPHGALDDALGDMLADDPEPEPPKPVKAPPPAATKKPAAAATATPARAAAPTPTPAATAARSKPAAVAPAPKATKPKEEPPPEPMFDEPRATERPSTPQPAAVAQVAPAAPAAGLAAAPAVVTVASAPAAAPLERAAIVRRIQHALIDELELRGVPLTELYTRHEAAESAARQHVERLRSAGLVARDEPVDALVQRAAAAATDVGPLRELLADETVLEIVVGPTGEILAEREGQLSAVDQRFTSEVEVVAMIRRLALLAGSTDEGPLVDVRLRDGARLVASLPPLSFRGPTMSLRKTTREAFTLDALAQQGTLSDGMQRLVEYAVRYRRGILLAVGPGVGASATLNAIASIVPVDERVVTIESGVEIHVLQTHATALEPSAGLGLDRLVAHAVALQPDRAIIGHLQGAGVAEVVTAVAGPLEGSVACCAAATAEQAMDKLAQLIAGDAPTDRARALLARAFPLVLVEQRFADGSRRITEMAEVRAEPESVVVDPVFTFEVEGVDANGLISGTFKATGHRPRFLEELNERGLEVDMSIFTS
jgi:pilus assembly protein CpaF